MWSDTLGRTTRTCHLRNSMGSSRPSSRPIEYVDFTESYLSGLLTVGAGKQKCQIENRTAAEDARSNRKRATEDVLAQEAEETAALDKLLEKLRNGDNIGRRARRARPSAVSSREPALPPSDKEAPSPPISSALGGSTAADIALGMLEQLKTNGFVSESFGPVSPTTVSAPRRRRLRPGTMAAALAAELEAAGSLLGSPLSSPGMAGLGTFQDDGSDTGRED